jgi:exopolysaccharide biosynthesis predicted pyruvyltransferase EpsI
MQFMGFPSDLLEKMNFGGLGELYRTVSFYGKKFVMKSYKRVYIFVFTASIIFQNERVIFFSLNKDFGNWLSVSE